MNNSDKLSLFRDNAETSSSGFRDISLPSGPSTSVSANFSAPSVSPMTPMNAPLLNPQDFASFQNGGDSMFLARQGLQQSRNANQIIFDHRYATTDRLGSSAQGVFFDYVNTWFQGAI